MPGGIADEAWRQAKNEIISVLAAVAAARKTISYSALAQKISAVRLGPDDPRLHSMLGEVSTEEDRAGRGMLSVLVVHKTGDMEPGDGFFKLAVELKKKFSDREKFWIDELNRVYAVWQASKPVPSVATNWEASETDFDEDELGSGTVNQEQRASAVWDTLADCAQSRQTITYKELGKRAGGLHQRVLRFPLGLIQDFCMIEKLAPLTSLVVHAGDARPGTGFIAWDADDLETAHQKAFGFDWSTLPNPFGYAADGTTEEELAARLVEVPSSSADVYQRVKVRGKAQAIFRAALLRAYDWACAFCGLTFSEALDAAHIVPWAQCSGDERMSVNNGILLCSNHHEMFDANWLRVGEDFKIKYSDMAREHGPYSPMDESVSVKLHGKSMTLPKNKKLWPDPTKIRERYRT